MDLTDKDIEHLAETLYEIAHKLRAPFDEDKDVLLGLTRFVLNDEFKTWPASGEKGVHHHFRGGLLVHTCEVVKSCLMLTKLYTKHEEILDPIEIYLSALFHDTGKVFDYARRVDEHGKTVWTKTQHKRRIHHISRSVLLWHQALAAVPHSPEFYENYADAVTHNILAHHGRREWGSPVAPNTRVAWLLHLCDSISARLDDCDTLEEVRANC